MAKRKGKGKGKNKRRTAAQRAATARMIAANKGRRAPRRRTNPPASSSGAGKRKTVSRGATVRTVIVNPSHAPRTAPVRRRRRRRNPSGGMLYNALAFLAAGAGGYLLDSLADYVIPKDTAAAHPDAIRYGKIGAGVLGGLALGTAGKMPAAGAGLAIGMAGGPIVDTVKGIGSAAKGAATAALPAGTTQALQGLLGMGAVGSPAPFPAFAEVSPASWPEGEAPSV